MFGLGHTELIIIMVIGMILFGAKKLPDIGSGMGVAIRNFKKGMSAAGEEIKEEPGKIEEVNMS